MRTKKNKKIKIYEMRQKKQAGWSVNGEAGGLACFQSGGGGRPKGTKIAD
jgi:hypothetical protein